MQNTVRVPDTRILVNGTSTTHRFDADLDSVTVQEDLDALSMFTLVLNNWDPARRTVSWSDADLLAVGTEVDIALGHTTGLHRVLVGEITGLEASFPAEQAPTLTVRGYDHRHRLARGRRTRTFTGMTDAAIAERIGGEAGLRVTAVDPGFTPDSVFQPNLTDLEFLRGRARLIGYELFVQDKVLHLRPPGHDRGAGHTLRVGRDLLSFTPRLSSLDQAGEAEVRGWDPGRKAAIVGTSTAAQDPMGGATTGPRQADSVFGEARAVAIDVPVHNDGEADRRARGLLTGLALGYVHAEAECEGNPRLRAGQVVDVLGAGRTFSGSYYVTAVTHEFVRDGGFTTHLDLRRTAA